MPPWRTDPRAALAATVTGALIVVGVTVLDVLSDAVLVAAVMAGPVVALLAAGERAVTVLAAAAVAMVMLSGIWNDNLGHGDYFVRLLLVATGSAATVLAARTRRGERRHMRRMELLAQIGEVADGSLSVGATAERIVHVLAPALGDLAVIDAVRGNWLARLAAHGTGAQTVRGAGPGRLPEAPRLLESAGEVAEALGADHAVQGLDRGLVVPLQTRGRALGALTLAGSGGRPFDREDLEFVRVAAGRAALALDNAGLSSELAIVERQLAGALSNLAEAVTIQDAEGRVVFANQAAADLLGFRRVGDVIHTPAPEIVASFRTTHTDGRPLELAELPGRRILAGEDPEPLLVRVESIASGEVSWRVIKATAVRDGRGAVQFAVNVVEDVTEVKRAELAQRLLAEASAVLASSLDPEATLSRIAEVVVPDVADWCTVSIPDESGEIKLVAIAHTDPEKLRWARGVAARFPSRIENEGGIARVLREGTPELIPDIPPELLEASARDPEHLEALREVGMRSAVLVPIEAGGEVIGGLTLVNSGSGRAFTEADMELAIELGRRAGVAIANSRLYQERADLAETLQEELLPPTLEKIPGWATAAMYAAAGGGADVGGDFYDAFPVPGGWMLIVGDVAGRGPAAASLTALARHTLRTAGMLTGDPAQAVRLLNRALIDRQRLALCTVCVVQIHEGARTGEVTVLAAGHPDPYLIPGFSDDPPRPITVGGPLLGAVQDGDWPAVSVRLAPGDQLVLYTDGVIDAPGEGSRFGEARLAETLAGSAGAEESIERVEKALAEFVRGARRDDAAVLVLERLGARARRDDAGADVLLDHHRVELPRSEEAPATARHAVEDWLDGLLDPDRLADVRLLVSELVTNGIMHATRRAGDVLDVDVAVTGRHIRVEVHDPGPGFTPHNPGPPPPNATSGRGLMLVDRIASRWGVDRGRRTCVWFEIDRG